MLKPLKQFKLDSNLLKRCNIWCLVLTVSLIVYYNAISVNVSFDTSISSFIFIMDRRLIVSL